MHPVLVQSLGAHLPPGRPPAARVRRPEVSEAESPRNGEGELWVSQEGTCVVFGSFE
jgi:hypothetical protein